MKQSKKFEQYRQELARYRESTKNTEIGMAMSKFAERLKQVTARLEEIEDQDTYEGKPWPKTQNFTSSDGSCYITWDRKLHNWDGPALIPEGDKKRAEYYLYGIKYSLEDWKEMKKQWEGLPWYKTPAILADAGTARN